ncbi:transposase orfA for insertion sequence element [Candidatus Omnitrophus magneticus]|uniref:Transposase orfA for insertion sequence element n=1 Tax=Candidatus Omnitrophus magneticus TaxID=1609969 RepID=A0A0F0CQC0_9BACT|nr:transposase orfA for insertion sequence element [Candidatus Omnitrophus magneticus]
MLFLKIIFIIIFILIMEVIMIKQKDWVDMRNLLASGLTKTEIAKQLGVSRKTVFNNLKKNSTPIYSRKKTIRQKIESFKECMNLRLEKYNLTATKLYKEIQNQGYLGKYGMVARYVSFVKDSLASKAVLRFETLPGEQAQVDWGHFGKFYDRETKQTISLYCFLIILGFSRTLYVEFFSKADIFNLAGNPRL